MSFEIPRDYSLIAPVYDQVFNRALSEGHKKIGSLLRSKRSSSNLRVLEVGVGSGLSFGYLPNNVEYTGVDINEKMLSLAHQKAKKMRRKKIALALMDAHRLSYKSNSFDLVLAASVITAVENPFLAMKEMIRVTKRGGQIAIVANLRSKDSFKSQIVKRFDPLTKKFLGFRTDINSDYFQRFKEIRMIENEQVNILFGFPLSSFLLFKKV